MIRLLTISFDETLALDLLHCFAFVKEHTQQNGEYLSVAKAILITFPNLREEFDWLDCADGFEDERCMMGHA